MRIKMSVNTKKRKRAILKQAKGYWGARSKLYRVAIEAVMKSGKYAYVGRRLKKRNFRTLWIARINAACRSNGLTYSRFIDGLNKLNVQLNRKVLAELAVNDAAAFTKLADQVKALQAK